MDGFEGEVGRQREVAVQVKEGGYDTPGPRRYRLPPAIRREKPHSWHQVH